MKLAAIILILLEVTHVSIGSRILFLFPTPSKSHMVIVNALSEALAGRGHDVTVATTYPLGRSVKNHREIQIPLNMKAENRKNEIIVQRPKNLMEMISLMLEANFLQAEELFVSKKFEEILREKFDLVFIGMNFQNFLLGYGEHFDCPTMILSVQRHITFTNLIGGNPMSINAFSHMNIAKSDMNFINRIKNFLLHGSDLLFYEYASYKQKAVYEKYFASNKRTYDETLQNVSAILVNDHFTESGVRPNVPNFIDIRGIQVKTVSDQLPDKLQKFLDEATDGAIFFSLGSNLNADVLSMDKVKQMLSVLSKLRQRVVMKWDTDEFKDLSDNLYFGKWLPQDDILAHPNVKLFVSHCGLGSVVESKFHAVPILGLPTFADQLMNSKIAVKEGWAIQMDMKNLDAGEFKKTIEEMIYDEKYSSTVKSLSRLFRDRPMSPLDTAIYWTEYVINHKGAKHMQFAAASQNFFQRNSLDVIGFFLLCLYVIVKLVKFVFRKVCGMFCRQKKDHKKKD